MYVILANIQSVTYTMTSHSGGVIVLAYLTDMVFVLRIWALYGRSFKGRDFKLRFVIGRILMVSPSAPISNGRPCRLVVIL